jgi:hypothetical protein
MSSKFGLFFSCLSHCRDTWTTITHLHGCTQRREQIGGVAL